MNSFRLATESRRDMALTVAGIIVTAAVFLVLDRLDLSSAAINMVALVGAAMFFSFFVSGAFVEWSAIATHPLDTSGCYPWRSLSWASTG